MPLHRGLYNNKRFAALVYINIYNFIEKKMIEYKENKER